MAVTLEKKAYEKKIDLDLDKATEKLEGLLLLDIEEKDQEEIKIIITYQEILQSKII